MEELNVQNVVTGDDQAAPIPKGDVTIGAPVSGPKPGAVDETLYTTEELAAWLMISPSTIEKDRSLGRGSYPVFVKVGGRRVMYRHADVIAWLHGNRYNHDSTVATNACKLQ